ncbi:MAG: type II toxin-antitoxin system VapC family toxin [Deltaproteobacteria bacterium]|nr:type II toxin-antitoxin system VapC family toxin [Deltaproteobacteria bacterium]
MAGLLFDSSVYIAALRQGDLSILQTRRAQRTGAADSAPLWLSTVVLAELLVGAREQRDRRPLLEMEQQFLRLKRVVVPEQRDWRLAGQVLAEMGKRYGYEQVGQVRLFNDALIAMSAARLGFTVITRNAKDCRRIAALRPFQWEDTGD